MFEEVIQFLRRSEYMHLLKIHDGNADISALGDQVIVKRCDIFFTLFQLFFAGIVFVIKLFVQCTGLEIISTECTVVGNTFFFTYLYDFAVCSSFAKLQWSPGAWKHGMKPSPAICPVFIS